ncbi:Inner membrane ABC transporter permease protein YejE [Pantoea ananatis]|nr:Inner membrane ABC transporter permease protein YejE [Pantoea ananatis]
MRLSPLNQQRWQRFRHHRRGYWSLWIFLSVFMLSLCAEFIANDKPLLVHYQQRWYAPLFFNYSESDYGGPFATAADYQDPWLQQRIENHGWALWAPIRFGANSINFASQVPFPSPPSRQNWLGTDANGGDVMARLLYGLRISLLFGVLLTLFSSVIGIVIGAIQGYFGGKVDLIGQRLIEVWSGMPSLFLLILLSSVIQPSFWWLLLVTVLFGWMSLVSVVRAEFLRTRNFDYIRAAQALGVSDGRIMLRHILPNAMVATLTFLPFILCGSITTLTSLDFLGFGLPIGSPSLGELLLQGKITCRPPGWVYRAFLRWRFCCRCSFSLAKPCATPLIPVKESE